MDDMYFFGMVISGAGAELEQPMFFVFKNLNLNSPYNIRFAGGSEQKKKSIEVV